MKKIATTDDYNKLATIICVDSTVNGTGCLVWSEDSTRLYCLTAKHCTMDIENGIHHSVNIYYQEVNAKNQLKIIGEKIYSDDVDLAIYEIEKNDITSAVPYTHISSLATPPSKVQINGYPIAQNTERIVLNATFNSKTDDEIVLNISDSKNSDNLDDIIGVSGSGCYEIVGKTIKLFGIENKSRGADLPYNELHAIDLSFVKRILSSKGLPLLPQPTPTYLTERFGKYEIAQKIKNSLVFRNSWVDLSISAAIHKKVEEHFKYSEDLSIYLCGLSGIGKTRGCINACCSLGYGNAIYYKNYTDFFNNEIKFKNYVSTNYENLYIIIDEATLADWNNVNTNYSNFSDYLRFIMIGTVSIKQSANLSKNAFFFENSSSEEIKLLVSEQYPLFDEEILTAIYKLSYSDLRLAMLIAQLYYEDNSIDYSMSSSTYLQNQYTSANSILERTILQHNSNPRRPHDLVVEDYFDKLSLFVDIDITNKENSELSNMSKYFQDNISNYLRCIDYIEDINLGIRKGKYFELSPRALAKLAFEQQGWSKIRYDLDNFMEALSTDVLRKRFYDRVDECGLIRGEVEEALASWFLKKYPCTYDALEKGNSNEIMLFVEHKPEIGLKWLKKIILDQPDSKLSETNYFFPRREVVWTCEHLANFKEWFSDCEEILFKLACNEVEHGISNNSKGVWSDYFSILLANTEVDFFQRYSLLIIRAKSCNKNNLDLFSKAFSNVFSDRNMGFSQPKMIGGRITPERWDPKTFGELWDAKKFSLTQLEKAYNAYDSDLQADILDSLFKNSWSFVSQNLEEIYKNTLTKFLFNQKPKNLLILHLEDQIKMIEHSPDINKEWIEQKIEFISKWIDELKDKTLIGRVAEYLSRDIWSHGYSDEDKERIEAFLEDVAVEILNDTSVILNIITEKSYDKEAVSTLAEKIGKHDAELKCYSFLEKIVTENLEDAFLRGYFLGNYHIHKKLDERLVNFIDENKYTYSDFALWVSCRIEVNLQGFNRILELINITKQIFWVDNLISSIWREFLSLEQKLQICNSISNCGHELRFTLLFKLLINWIKNTSEADSVELYKVAIKSFRDCIENGARFESFSVMQLFENTPTQFYSEVLELIVPLFDFDSLSDSKNIYCIRCILKLKNTSTEALIMSLLGETLLEPRRILKGKAHRGFFDSFAVETVKEWIDIEPKLRAPLIAYHLSSPTLSDDSLAPLTKFVLSNYNDNDEVVNEFIAGEYNLVSYWVETIYSNKDNWYGLLEKYLKSDIPFVRRWAEYKQSDIKNVCIQHENDIQDRKRFE